MRSGLARGFQHYEDFRVSVDEALACLPIVQLGYRIDWLNEHVLAPSRLGRKSGEEVNAEFLAWLGDGHERPFFAFPNYFDAHSPYNPPEPYERCYLKERPSRSDPPDLAKDLSRDQIKAMKAA